MKTVKTVQFIYWIGDKKQNNFLRSLDLYSEDEGIFINQKGTVSLKSSKKITEKWKEKFAQIFIKANEKLGYEVCNLVFLD